MSHASRSKRAVAAIGLAALASTALVSNASAFGMMGGHGFGGGGFVGGGFARGGVGSGMAAFHPAFAPHFGLAPRFVAAPRFIGPHFAVTPHLVGAPRFGGGVHPSFAHLVPTHKHVAGLARAPLGHIVSLAALHAHHPPQVSVLLTQPASPSTRPAVLCFKGGCGPAPATYPVNTVVIAAPTKPSTLKPGVYPPIKIPLLLKGTLKPGVIPLIPIGVLNPPKIPIIPLPKTPGIPLKPIPPIGLPLPLPLPLPVPIPVGRPIPVPVPVPLVPVPVPVPVPMPVTTAAVAQPVATRVASLAAPVAAVAAPPCGLIRSDLSVTFQPAITAADIATFTKAYNIAMADGPNVDGVYRIRLLQADLTQAQIDQIVASMRAQTVFVASVTPEPAPALPTTRTACGTYVSVTFVPTIHSVDVTAFLKAYNVTLSDGTRTDGSYTIRLSDQAIPSSIVDQIIDSMRGQAAFVSDVARL